MLGQVVLRHCRGGRMPIQVQIKAGVAQLGEHEPNCQWQFAVMRTPGQEAWAGGVEALPQRQDADSGTD